jgi:hypothetical protein
MTYFKLKLGFDCGVDKSFCQLGYPKYCYRCISKKFDDSNFVIDIFELIEYNSEEKRKEIFYKYIWRKYHDLMNIRHIIILSNNGLPAFNMAIIDLPIDVSLLSGFIQANIIFSSEELTLLDKFKQDKNFFEFEYKNFNILLKNGKMCRTCLILETKASNNLKDILLNFTERFEETFEDELKEFENSGDLDLLAAVKNFVEKSFDLQMISPLTLSNQIPPKTLIDFSIVQKAIHEFCKDILKEQSYFFISTILEKTYNVLGVFSKEEILWNIYQMIRDHIIFKINVEYQEEEYKIKKQQIKKRERVIQNISEMKNLEEIILESFDMNYDVAHKKIGSLLKKAEIALKDVAYQESLTEYQKALMYAKEFNMESEIETISQKILEIVKLNKNVELNFALEQANKAEKKKDYIIALKYLFRAKGIVNSNDDIISDIKNRKKMLRLDQKIEKIQNFLR